MDFAPIIYGKTGTRGYECHQVVKPLVSEAVQEWIDAVLSHGRFPEMHLNDPPMQFIARNGPYTLLGWSTTSPQLTEDPRFVREDAIFEKGALARSEGRPYRAKVAMLSKDPIHSIPFFNFDEAQRIFNQYAPQYFGQPSYPMLSDFKHQVTETPLQWAANDLDACKSIKPSIFPQSEGFTRVYPSNYKATSRVAYYRIMTGSSPAAAVFDAPRIKGIVDKKKPEGIEGIVFCRDMPSPYKPYTCERTPPCLADLGPTVPVELPPPEIFSANAPTTPAGASVPPVTQSPRERAHLLPTTPEPPTAPPPPSPSSAHSARPAAPASPYTVSRPTPKSKTAFSTSTKVWLGVAAAGVITLAGYWFFHSRRHDRPEPDASWQDKTQDSQNAPSAGVRGRG